MKQIISIVKLIINHRKLEELATTSSDVAKAINSISYIDNEQVTELRKLTAQYLKNNMQVRFDAMNGTIDREQLTTITEIGHKIIEKVALVESFVIERQTEM